MEGTQAGCLCLGAGLWYWLDPVFHGRGLMGMALGAALARWFARPAPPLIATCRTDNAASRALLARLGFGQSPRPRRMFFQGSGGSEPCFDYLMASEQWLLLNPPEHRFGALTLRPARQKDAPVLARMLRGRDPVWPAPEALPAFIERHRVRVASAGLFVVEDATTRGIGMALLTDEAPPALRFLAQDEADHHAAALERALAEGLPAP